eukprot:Nk52_evm22s2356 gene=Nk52_evmTU22s2356
MQEQQGGREEEGDMYGAVFGGDLFPLPGRSHRGRDGESGDRGLLGISERILGLRHYGEVFEGDDVDMDMEEDEEEEMGLFGEGKGSGEQVPLSAYVRCTPKEVLEELKEERRVLMEARRGFEEQVNKLKVEEVVLLDMLTNYPGRTCGGEAPPSDGTATPPMDREGNLARTEVPLKPLMLNTPSDMSARLNSLQRRVERVRDEAEVGVFGGDNVLDEEVECGDDMELDGYSGSDIESDNEEEAALMAAIIGRNTSEDSKSKQRVGENAEVDAGLEQILPFCADDLEGSDLDDLSDDDSDYQAVNDILKKYGQAKG